MTESDPFVQRVGQELLTHLSTAGLSICAFHIRADRVSLTFCSDRDLIDFAHVLPTVGFWLDQRGAELAETNAATRHIDGTHSLSFKIAPITGLPAVYTGESV